MNELKIFENEQYGNLRAIIENGEPWFIAADVCNALDIHRTAVRRLDADEKGVRLIHTPGGTQEMTTVSESGLYSLVLSSRKPEARQFKRWVTHDVIPSIRRTGAYVTPSLSQQILSDPDTLFLILEQLRNERTARLLAESNEQQTRQMLSSVTQQLDSVRHSPVMLLSNDPEAQSCCSMADLAAMLSSQKRRFTRNQLFALFRKHGYIQQNSPLPSSKGFESGYFLIIEKHSGSHHYYTTAVTLSGQLYFNSVFM